METATRFIDAVNETMEAICAMPQLGALKVTGNEMLSGLRFLPVRDFEDILIFYIVQPKVVLFVRVLHGKRDVKGILEAEQNLG